MASFNKFNAFAAAMPNGGVNLSSDTIKILLTNTAPVSTNTQYSDISGNELVSGNGYTTGGATVTLTSSSQSSGTYKYIASAGSPTWSFSGAASFRYVVMYDTTATTKYLIGWWDYGSTITTASGDTFTVTFDATNGVFQLA